MNKLKLSFTYSEMLKDWYVIAPTSIWGLYNISLQTLYHCNITKEEEESFDRFYSRIEKWEIYETKI